jgi:Outer membrane protein beta-barrel domain
MKTLVWTVIGGAFLCGSLGAQEFPRFAFNVGAGFTQPIGGTARRLDTGWNVAGGAGVNFSSYAGMMIQTDYTSLGVNSRTLSNVGFPGGNVNIFSARVDPVVHFKVTSPVEMYITGGGGLYHVTQEFTQPGVGAVSGFDPFFGFYRTLVPTTQVLSSYTINKPGLDIGLGFAAGSWRGGKFFAEARYNRIFMGNNRHTEYIPVTFGFRW